jgi:hypothetical protein
MKLNKYKNNKEKFNNKLLKLIILYIVNKNKKDKIKLNKNKRKIVKI